uniref:Uncharacterized protein n=1 Tax=Arundo donax TaxID=35708 RepID=A0A0A9CQS1_ARUDO
MPLSNFLLEKHDICRMLSLDVVVMLVFSTKKTWFSWIEIDTAISCTIS